MEQIEIGKAIQDARIRAGYRTRGELIEEELKGWITQEGLRKIEIGERIPRSKTIRLLAERLGLEEEKIQELEKMALERNIERFARKTTAETPAMFAIEGKDVKHAKVVGQRTESFTRNLVDSLTEIVEKYGLMPEDLAHFRRHARSKIVKHLRT